MYDEEGREAQLGQGTWNAKGAAGGDALGGS